MPTKIIEVVVTGVVGPKPFPVRLFLVGLLVVSCIIGGLFLAGNQAYQQSQNATATAIANSNATANAAATATQQIIAVTQTFKAYEADARSLVNVKDVSLLTEGRVMPNGGGAGGGIQPDKVSFIQFTVVNNSKLTLGISLEGCFPTSSITGFYPNGYIHVFGQFNPGEEKSVTCWLDTIQGQTTPETYCVPQIEIWDDYYNTWNICPYKYKK